MLGLKSAAEIFKISLLVFPIWRLETDTQPANDEKFHANCYLASIALTTGIPTLYLRFFFHLAISHRLFIRLPDN